jgi:hypothetical protein
MDNDEIEAILNLPESASFASAQEGIFQLQPPSDEPMSAVETPRDQIVTATKAFEQCALIVGLYYKAKYGVPMLEILQVQDKGVPEFHLRHE